MEMQFDFYDSGDNYRCSNKNGLLTCSDLNSGLETMKVLPPESLQIRAILLKATSGKEESFIALIRSHIGVDIVEEDDPLSLDFTKKMR